MNYPGTAVHAHRVALNLPIFTLADMTGVHPRVIAAWEAGRLRPSDNTVRVTICALTKAQQLHLERGFVPIDDNTIRWVQEQIVAALGIAVVV